MTVYVSYPPRILYPFSPQVIRRRGDLEIEAVANYMWAKHRVDIHREWSKEPWPYHPLKGRAMSFLAKYNAKVTIVRCGDVRFAWPVFKH